MRDGVARPILRRPRLRRLASEWRADRAVPAGRPGATAILLASAAGLAIGPLELALTLALESYYDPTPGLFRGNRHIIWIIPVVNLALFGLVGGTLALVTRFRRGQALRRTTCVLVFLGVLTLLLTVRGLHLAASVLLAAGFADRFGPRIEGAVRAHRRIVTRGIAGLAVVAAGLVALSAGRQGLAERTGLAGLPPAPPNAPNVLLIVLDTVRADHLSLYGYDRETTPNLARLARKGVRFDRARSPAPWTLPSHASMFTGRWPHELSAGLAGPLDGRHPTLAEAMRDRGYATAGFVANTTYCSAETGLARGFLHYEDHSLSPRSLLRATALGGRLIDPALSGVQKLATALGLRGGLSPGNGKAFKDAATINADFLAWLSDRPRRPFFAFLNYFDAHHPYLLPEGVDHHFGLSPESHADVLTLHRWWSLDKRRLPPRDVALARDAYDDCLAYLDAQLGRLFAELDRRGVLDQTLVIVTSDHGEHFGEHGLFGHASSLYSPEVHVPLVIVGPGVPAGGQVREPVSLRDLSATVVHSLPVSSAARFPGHSLARFWTGTDFRALEPVLSEVSGAVRGPANGGRSPVFRGPMKAIVSGETVYIRGGDGSEELYDLGTDPAETHNLAAQPGSASLLRQCREELRQLVSGDH
jgi:arylsulfatase A-like enzyme